MPWLLDVAEMTDLLLAWGAATEIAGGSDVKSSTFS